MKTIYPLPDMDPPPLSPFVTTWTPTSVAKMMGVIISGGATTAAVYQAPSAFARWAPTVLFILTVLAVIGIVAWNIFIKVKESKKDQ